MYKNKYAKWLVESGRSESTARKYTLAINNKLSQIANEEGFYNENLFSISDVEEFDPVKNSIMNLDNFKEFNSVGDQMYSSALNRYSEFLVEVNVSDFSEIETIFNDNTIDETTKKSVIESRVGQGRFRRELKEYWGACAVTGTTCLDVLIASHIKPWRESDNEERLDSFNGLLLQPNLDKLFDKGFITFQTNGNIVLKEEKKAISEDLGASASMQLSKVDDNHKKYLEYHQSKVFKSA